MCIASILQPCSGCEAAGRAEGWAEALSVLAEAANLNLGCWSVSVRELGGLANSWGLWFCRKLRWERSLLFTYFVLMMRVVMTLSTSDLCSFQRVLMRTCTSAGIGGLSSYLC